MLLPYVSRLPVKVTLPAGSCSGAAEESKYGHGDGTKFTKTAVLLGTTIPNVRISSSSLVKTRYRGSETHTKFPIGAPGPSRVERRLQTVQPTSRQADCPVAVKAIIDVVVVERAPAREGRQPGLGDAPHAGDRSDVLENGCCRGEAEILQLEPVELHSERVGGDSRQGGDQADLVLALLHTDDRLDLHLLVVTCAQDDVSTVSGDLYLVESSVADGNQPS
eukprot:768366-Hanusia_phi.AAC.4